MFHGDQSATVTSDEAAEAVYAKVGEALEALGQVSVSDKTGNMTIVPASRFSNPLSETSMESSVKPRSGSGEYKVFISFNVKPTVLAWVIAGLGLLMYWMILILLLRLSQNLL